MTPSEFIDAASKITLSVGLLIVLWGGYKGAWLWRWQHNEILKIKDETVTDLAKQIKDLKDELKDWRKLALQNTSLAEASLESSRIRRDD